MQRGRSAIAELGYLLRIILTYCTYVTQWAKHCTVSFLQ